MEISFKCCYCYNDFSTFGDLRKHERSHTENVLNEQETTCVDLEKDYEENNDEKIFSCTTCDKGFSKFNELRRHNMCHNERKISCTKCKGTFNHF